MHHVRCIELNTKRFINTLVKNKVADVFFTKKKYLLEFIENLKI